MKQKIKDIKEDHDETSYAVIISDEIPERQLVRKRCQVKMQCMDGKSSVKCFVCKKLVCNKCMSKKIFLCEKCSN